MKKILLFVSLIALCLVGCIDTEEDLTVNADGTGVYKTTMDMSGLFDMLGMLAMMDTSANSQIKKIADKNIDSVFSLGSLPDTGTALSADEKRLLQNGTVRLIVNQNEKKFKMILNYPYKNFSDLEKIIALQQSGKGGFDPLGGNAQGLPVGGEDAKMPGLDFLKTSFKNGLIERRVDQQKLDELKDNEQAKQMQEAGEMLDAIKFNTVIHLPKAISNASGEKLTISDDKKTIRINYSLSDLMKNPKALEFKIEY